MDTTNTAPIDRTESAGRAAETAAAEWPQTRSDLIEWVQRQETVASADRARVAQAIDTAFSRQHLLWQESKQDAIDALSAGFADKLARLRTELTARDATVSTIAEYFETLVADLTERTHRDPKTRLMTFEWYLRQLQSFLELEQRASHCAVGLADVTGFKWYNDNLGHPLGDRILAQVALMLGEHIRSGELPVERPGLTCHDLHARLGGDEFCFFVSNLARFADGALVAERFRSAVARYDWTCLDPRLEDRPVRVDVGVVCVRLGAIRERRSHAAALSRGLVDLADEVMYEAKRDSAGIVHRASVRIRGGALNRVG